MSVANWLGFFQRKWDSLWPFKKQKGTADHHDDWDLPRKTNPSQADFMDSWTTQKEILGIPKGLLPFYIAFALDSIAVGLVMPLLPFTVMELGANAFELSLVVSSNYIAQSIGVTIMGRVSDTYGRKVVMTMCLLASTMSYLFLSQAETLIGFASARIISGSFGGLIPVVQSTVADSSTQMERPKYLGRIMATFGLGFVIGPAISALLMGWSTRQKIRLASLLPFIGLNIIHFVAKETKKNVRPLNLGFTSTSDSTSTVMMASETNGLPGSPVSRKWKSSNSSSAFGSASHLSTAAIAIPAGAPVGISSAGSSSKLSSSSSPLISRAASPLPSRSLFSPSNTTSTTTNTTAAASLSTPFDIYLLVLNGFAIMFAFATETIYAMFIKDSFGYGESTLSTIFAINGLFIGLFQVFFIKPVISMIGKHATLALGNVVLAIGMMGVALIRQTKPLHFAFFSAHIVGYSVADTTLASLISKYSSPATQGRDLALNQAAQACARVVSPLIAGMLYEYSKQPHAWLPVGALPFLVGAMCPLIALTIPTYLYLQKRARKMRRFSLFTETSSLTTANLAASKGHGWRGITSSWFQMRPPIDVDPNADDLDEYTFTVSSASDSNSDTEAPMGAFH